MSGLPAPASHARRVIGEPVPTPAPETRRLYANDWARFTAWCRAVGVDPLPATPDTLAAFLLAVAPGLSRGALGRHRAAVVATHRERRQPIPVLDDAALAAVRAASRPAAPFRRAAGLEGDRLAAMAEQCARDLAGLRDRALLLLAARLSEPPVSPEAEVDAAPGHRATRRHRVPRIRLLELDAEHIRFTADGMQLHLRSRVDTPAPDQAVDVARTTTACPVRALEDWLRASDTWFGPVFRKVDQWGNVEHGRLGPDAWPRIVGRYSVKLGRRPGVRATNAVSETSARAGPLPSHEAG